MFQTALLYLVSWYKRQLHVTMIFIYMYYNHGGLIKACLVSVTLVILGLRSRQKTLGKIRCLCLRWVYFFPSPKHSMSTIHLLSDSLSVLFVSVLLLTHLKIFKNNASKWDYSLCRNCWMEYYRYQTKFLHYQLIL